MKSRLIKKKLIILLNHLQYYNKLAPFNIYDSDYVSDVENKLKDIMENNKYDYDEDPVEACRHCKSLHIKNDELDNGICFKCGSVNELTTFLNIKEYIKYLDGRDL